MALDGVVVLDLTRILAGPTATQMLGDLGATVIKIENPDGGDDTRTWGPPFVPDAPDLSAYFLSSNRNKHSVTVDMARPEGQAILRKLAARADVVIENFKPGGLKKFGLDHETLCAAHPGLVYCSISGFGQTGPNREKPGYDLMAQGFGGIMSLTGDADGMPAKVGVGIADVMTGMYATVGVLAALRHRERTGEGQHVDISLVDATMAWLINEGCNYLLSGKDPFRRGNGHPNIVPYDAFRVRDGHVIVAVGNDAQFARFCDVIGLPHLSADPDFATNPGRLQNRTALMAVLQPALDAQTMAGLVAALEAVKVPVGPIQTVGQALASSQAVARGAVVEMKADEAGTSTVRLLGNPLKLSRTPVRYRRPPPRLGADTKEVLDSLDL
jgi:crotonobetainyl-CoA:carnitine CoA-transferase CaiB-like acyl-CoA transferase